MITPTHAIYTHNKSEKHRQNNYLALVNPNLHVNLHNVYK